ncbi:MAG: hypothetical protein ACSLEN_12635 [Candidatus Malihini olakiniferum]
MLDSITTSTGEYDDACQGSHLSRMPHMLLQPETRFDLSGQEGTYCSIEHYTQGH